MKTVVKCVSVGVEEKELKEELVGMGFKVNSVVRMRKGKASPFDMVAVTSERSESGRKLLEVRKLGGFQVRVEDMRKPASLPQCFKCQQFGYVQFRCTGKEVCAETER